MFVRRITALVRAGVGAAVLAAGFGFAVFVAPTSATASETPTIAICSNLHAAHWKTAHKSGTTWYVSATSPTKCGFAEKVGAALTHMKVDASGNFAKSPKGYVCGGSPFGGQPQNILCHAHFGTGSFNVTIAGI